MMMKTHKQLEDENRGLKLIIKDLRQLLKESEQEKEDLKRQLYELRQQVLGNESLDTSDKTYCRITSPNIKGHSPSILEERKTDANGGSPMFNTPTEKKYISVHSFLANQLRTHRIRCTPSKSGRHSASPPKIKLFTNDSRPQLHKQSYTNTLLSAKPLMTKRRNITQSPKGIFQLPTLKFPENIDESFHKTPYVLPKRGSCIPATTPTPRKYKNTISNTASRVEQISKEEYFASSKKARKHEEKKAKTKTSKTKSTAMVKNDKKLRKQKREKRKKEMEERREDISNQICCKVAELNPKNKENPFELADDTAHERSRYSHQKIGKYSKVTEMVRSPDGNKVKKHISVKLSQQERFGHPSFDRIFNDFFILGIENSGSIKIDLNKCVQPSILYSYVNYEKEEDIKRIDTIKDFCFPDGLKIEEIYPEESKFYPYIEDALYSKHPFRKNSFVFTLNNTEDQDRECDYINFLCIRFTDIVKCKIKLGHRGYFLTQKAYCFRFDHSCYELILDIANTMISMSKDSWVHEMNRFSITGSSNEKEIPFKNELIAFLRNRQMSLEMINLLDDLNSYEFSHHQGTDIEYRVQGDIMRINFIQPTIKEYRYFDAKWFSPILFTRLTIDEFLKVLYAVMLERTVVFISNDIQYSSCAVLAIRALLEPFKICFAMIPVMPQAVIDYLSAPVPLLIGLPNKLLENNRIDYSDRTQDLNEEINWIHLDNKHKTLWNRTEFKTPYLSNLRDRIYDDYEFIRKFNKNLVEYQSDDVYDRVINIASTIRQSFIDHFIRPLPHRADPEEPLDMSEVYFENDNDKEFFKEFSDTLMFHTYIQESFKEQ